MKNVRQRRPVVRFRKSLRHGATVVEFAIAVPVFLLLVFASIEFGRINVVRHTLDNAAYEAARVGIVPGATRAEVESKANELLSVVRARNATVDVDPPILNATVNEVTVNISIPAGDNAWVMPRFTGATTISSSATLRTERYRGIQ